MDFYIFWKFGTCRTPPSTRQLFYHLVNLLLPSLLPIPSSSTLPSPYFYSIILPLSSHTPYLTYPPIPTQNLSTTYPQVINKLSTAFPQVIHNPIDLSSIPIFPLILLFLQSSPLYFLLYPHQKLSTGALSYPQVIHNLIYLSTGYPQIYPTYLTFKPTFTLTQLSNFTPISLINCKVSPT